jgi:hypothetical protein
MNSNPFFIERMMKDKVSTLQAEGLRSQSLARAGLKGSAIHFPDLRQPFRRLVGRLFGHSLPRIEQPQARKRLAH